MCGLAGIYSYSGRATEPSVLARMTHSLAHRGPDSFGFCFAGEKLTTTWREKNPPVIEDRGIALGHRRLRILDLSDAGDQPLFSQDGRYCIVYNGEVYNYLELRDELQALGHSFKTTTDTEVVLTAYAQWGKHSFNKLNGMWALLIWDSHERTVTACRDRFGIKPLYYQAINGAILFGSEVKAILQHPEAICRPNPASVIAYLARISPPSPGATFFEGISTIKPGNWMTFDSNGNSTSDEYWKLPSSGQCTDSFEEAGVKLRDLLEDSVRLRLRSDVQVGTMLSGGLDSTSVIALVAKRMKLDSNVCAITGERLHAFTADFPAQAANERKNADILCNLLPVSKHSVFPLDEPDIVSLLNESTYAMEMPWFNSVPLVHSLLMKRARREQVSVVLNGHGSDEIYAGYPQDYCPVFAADAILGMHWLRAKNELAGMQRIHGMGPTHALKSIQSRLSMNIKRRLGRGDRWSDESIVRAELLQRYPSEITQPGSPHSGLDQKLKNHFFQDMLPSWLQLEDRISMAHSIESRLPFMDYRLIEYGFSLPDEYKIRNGQTKAILRNAMREMLPKTITEDSTKTPFSGPDSAWIENELKPVVQEYLGTGNPRIEQFVEPIELQKLVQDHAKGHVPATRLWRLLSTEIWMRSFFDGENGTSSLLEKST